MTIDRELVAEILRDPAPKSMVYMDSTVGSENPEATADIRRKRVRDKLAQAGAPLSDVEAIVAEMSQVTGVADPSARFVVAQNGRLRLHAVMGGPMTSKECLHHGPVVDVTPLLMQLPDDDPFLVVRVWRGGGDISVVIEGDRDPVISRRIEGDTSDINKVSVGRMSEAGHQRHVEEVWKHNQDEIAGHITELIASNHPRIIFVSGDVRAVQLLSEQLSDQARHLLHVIPGEGNTEGASEERIRHAIDVQLDAARRRTNAQILDQAAASNGREQAKGIGAVVHALAQGQAETVLIDTSVLLDHDLLALDAEPWIATAPEDALGANVLEDIVATAGVVRAAVLTDARIRFVEPNEIGVGVGVVAALRWPVGPPRP